MNWQDQLIALYLFICKQYQEKLKYYSERFTHYADLSFSDEEVLTIYLFGILVNHCQTEKDIYNHTSRYLSSWFPKLPAYSAFIRRVNQLHGVFVPLIEHLQTLIPMELKQGLKLIDAMPIIMAQQGRRYKAKVAREFTTPNGYCPTKNLYYYGVKLHVLASQRKGALPIPEYIALTDAGASDLHTYELLLNHLQGQSIFADKAYQRENKPIFSQGSEVLHTPVKKQKGQTYLEAADQLLSKAVSSIRQPIESFFNCLEEKTHIQMASKVRSYHGLMVHVFGRIAAAFFILSNALCS